MYSKKLSLIFLIALAVFALATTAFTQEIALHDFVAGKDGNLPDAGVVSDAAGNLFGTTGWGGNITSNCSNGCGVVFELTPTASGSWKETLLYHFKGGRDGEFPTQLTLDAAGNIYGIAASGGQPTRGTPRCMSSGCGTVFRLSPSSNGWTFNLLHAFTGWADGARPAGITLDSAVNLFVTTIGLSPQCPQCNAGTVFELIGGVTGHTVYQFPASAAVSNPGGPVLIDSAGNLFGAALQGTGLWGGIYEISPGAGGTWTESVIHSFANQGNDGANPLGPLVMDSSGNLYGTALQGGGFGLGAVFELTPSSTGQWTENTLHTFRGSNDGANPAAGIAMDSAGNLFGVSSAGGNFDQGNCSGGCGALFELMPSATGWTVKALHTFLGTTDGRGGQHSAVLIDQSGNLYSTSRTGGKVNSSCAFGCGLVYEFPGVAAPAR